MDPALETGLRFIPSSHSSLTYNYTLDDPNLSPEVGSIAETPSPTAPIIIIPERATFTAPVKRLALESLHHDKLAYALGFSTSSKVLEYQNYLAQAKSGDTATRRSSLATSSSRIPKSSYGLDIAGPLLSSTSSQELLRALTRDMEPCLRTPSPRPAKHIYAKKILQAPGLRNDFYSNLVCWLPYTSKIGVGVGTQAFLWGVDNVVQTVPLDNAQIITAISCSSNDYMVIATHAGTVFLCDAATNTLVSEYTKFRLCIYCVQWIPSTTTFLAGDDGGSVHAFTVANGEITHVTSFKTSQQQICGM